MENQPRKRHGNQKVGHAILLLFAMKINDFRGSAGLRIHENSCENRENMIRELSSNFCGFWMDFGSILRAFLDHFGDQMASKIFENSGRDLERPLEASERGLERLLEASGASWGKTSAGRGLGVDWPSGMRGVVVLSEFDRIRGLVLSRSAPPEGGGGFNRFAHSAGPSRFVVYVCMYVCMYVK